MDDNEQRLPPLPHYDDTSCGGEGMFTAQTMREYAIAAHGKGGQYMSNPLLMFCTFVVLFLVGWRLIVMSRENRERNRYDNYED